MTSFPASELLGVPFHRLTMADSLRLVHNWVSQAEPRQVSVVNVHSVVMARRDHAFRSAVRNSHLVICDSTPLFWLSHLVGEPLPERIAGPDFCEAICRLAEEKSYRMFFMGSTPATLEKIIGNVKKRFPGVTIAGAYSPPLRDRFSPEDCEEMLRVVNEGPVDILWVGMTAPKQEKWIYENLGGLRCRVVAGIGAAFDFIAGNRRRAPRWVQSAGLEWLFRFCQEPRRLWKRYLISNPIFVLLSLREILKKRLFS